MKLRNKKTGEIIETDYMFGVSVPTTETFGCKSYDQIAAYSSLAELNEEWEDYEEPKKHYEILAMGAVMEREDAEDEIFRNQGQREIGNYFETKEEAEKAVEKLKAWKRLKDKGFDIEGWDNHIGDNYYKTGQIVINLNNVKNRDWDEYDNIGEIKEDLDLLFSQEDEEQEDEE